MAKKTKSHDFSNPGNVQDVELYETARRRYLNYAISVITSRAVRTPSGFMLATNSAT